MKISSSLKKFQILLPNQVWAGLNHLGPAFGSYKRVLKNHFQSRKNVLIFLLLCFLEVDNYQLAVSI